MKYFVYLLLLLIPLTACKRTRQSVKKELKSLPNVTLQLDSTGVPIEPNTNYFPLELDSLKVPFFSNMLFAMYEPILYDSKINKESYRFLWLRTVKNPVAVRLEKQNDTISLYIKITSGTGGVGPGRLVTSDVKILSQKEWNEFQELLKQSDFWNMPALDDETKIAGSQWILEGFKTDDYNLTDVWDPENDDPYKKACEYLLDLAGIPKN